MKSNIVTLQIAAAVGHAAYGELSESAINWIERWPLEMPKRAAALAGHDGCRQLRVLVVRKIARHGGPLKAHMADRRVVEAEDLDWLQGDLWSGSPFCDANGVPAED